MAKWLKKFTNWIKDIVGPEKPEPAQQSRRTKIQIAKPVLVKKKTKKAPQAKKVKPAKKKKPAFKPKKKAPVKKAKPIAKKVLKKPVSKKTAKPASAPKPEKKKEAAPGILVGKITHYFPKAGAAVLMVEKEEIKTGAKILIKGTSTNLKMTAKSIQINRIPVPSGKPGEDIGIGVTKPVEPGDLVYLV